MREKLNSSIHTFHSIHTFDLAQAHKQVVQVLCIMNIQIDGSFPDAIMTG